MSILHIIRLPALASLGFHPEPYTVRRGPRQGGPVLEEGVDMTRARIVLHVVVDARPGSRVWGAGGHGGGSHLFSARVVADKQKQRLAAGRWGGAHSPELDLHVHVPKVTGFQNMFANPLPRGHCVRARVRACGCGACV